MEKRSTEILQRAAGLVVGIAIAIIGFLLIVLGLTFLPVIGIFAGVFLMSLSAYFFNPAAVEMSREEKESILWTRKEGELWCTWPPGGFKNAA